MTQEPSADETLEYFPPSLPDASTESTTAPEQEECVEEDTPISFPSGRVAALLSQLRQLASSSHGDNEHVQKAESIFNTLTSLANNEGDPKEFVPLVYAYNYWIKVLSKSDLENGAERAQQVLREMQASSSKVQPNLLSYLFVVDGWSFRKSHAKALALLDEVMELFESTTSTELEPDVSAYNSLLRVHRRSGNYEEVERIYRELIHKDADDPCRANTGTFLETMRAFAFTDDKRHRVRDVFDEMQSFNTTASGTLPMDAYCLLIASMKGSSHEAANEAESVLFDLIAKYNEGDRRALPSTELFREVLFAQRYRPHTSVGKVELLLHLREWFFNKTNSFSLQPSMPMYNEALRAMSHSRDFNKAIRSRMLLEKMLNSTATNTYPDSSSYYHILQSCATTDITSDEQRDLVFEICLQSWNEVTRDLLGKTEPGSATQFLRACARLIPDRRERDKTAKEAFLHCCGRGVVDKRVLSAFTSAASEALQLEVFGGVLDDLQGLPPQWSENVTPWHRNTR